MILLINKDHCFNENMIKDYEMIEYDNYNEETIFVESATFRHFEMLRAHLKIDDIIIDIKSAYRSLEYQENLFLKSMNEYGIEYTENNIAMPGFSDHHTGQAIDLVIYKNGKWIKDKEELLKEKEIFNKIHKCLKYFGFIVRYPEKKKSITGYYYIPWHIRYIGEEDALKIGDRTLEEYLVDGKAKIS